VDLRGEGAGIHLGLTTLPAALYIDLDRNGIGLQLDTIVATGFHLRSGFPGLSRFGLNVWLFGSGIHLGTDSVYLWSFPGGQGFDFIHGEGFQLSPSPIHKARFFGAYGGPGFQGFGMIGAPLAPGQYSAQGLRLGTPGFDVRPRDAVDAAYRLHDIQFNGAGGPVSWGDENNRALVARIRDTVSWWWHDPFALAKAGLTLLIWQ
jgi:hypothetical protein